jgi:hypothetical protein
MPRTNIMDTVMNEHIRLPGCPQIIVTRAFAWDWLQKVGYSPEDKGFGGLDYAVFHQLTPCEEPLTDIASVADFLDAVVRDLNAA